MISQRSAAPLLALVCSLSFASCDVYSGAPPQGTLPAHCRVTWTSDPATTATISWSTARPGKSHTVHYQIRGDEDSKGTLLAESGRFTGGQTELYYHHARLSDLKPSTFYEVQMQSDADKSRVFYFQTAPAEDRPFSILHGGDSRSNQDARCDINTVIGKMIEDSYANDDPADDILAFAHGGDYTASGVNMDQWSRWLSDHELTGCSDGRLIPMIPARGNHDKGKPFNEVFGFPDEDLNYYAIDLGPQVRFVTLNTETSTAGDQARWLDQELGESRPKHRWLLTQYHRPAYPAVKPPGTALQSWVRLFEEHNVDLVCESDGHNIKRTVPIRDDQYDETGVVYIGEGGLGVSQRTPKTTRWYLQSPGMADRGNHVFVLSFTRDGLIGKCILEDGTERDRFVRPVRNP